MYSLSTLISMFTLKFDYCKNPLNSLASCIHMYSKAKFHRLL